MNPLEDKGYLILEQVFSDVETDAIAAVIAAADTSTPSFRKTDALFAIRRFLEAVPGVVPYVFTEKLLEILTVYAGPGFFGTKAIYFDKPEQSNWFVAYHQDLTISVDRKTEIEGYGPWTKNRTSLQYSRHYHYWKIILRSVYTSTIPMLATAH